MDRLKIRDRIRALRKMTAGRGCTEAEALAAAAKAAELMQKAGLTENDIELGDSEIRTKVRGHSVISRLWPVIAHCTNTSTIVLGDQYGNSSVFFVGREPGPEIAVYLWTICERAVNREVRTFKTSQFYRRRRALTTKRQAVQDFKTGMVERLTMRLLELFEPVINENDRAVAQSALVERFPDREVIAKRKTSTRFSAAAAEGWRAGNAVPLNRGVGGAADTVFLGN